MLVTFLSVLAIAVVAFLALYAVARRFDNFGIVDVAWAAGFMPVAAVYAVVGAAPFPRRVALTILVFAWAGRLSWYLGRRVGRLHPSEDGRYVQLRREWESGFEWKMGTFFAAQAVVLVLLSGPFLLIASNASPGWRAWEWLGAALVLVGILGETIADRQLARYKREHAGAGVCDVGLWRLSRHPNYFFEWLVWVGWAVWAWPAPAGPWAVACPLFMLWLILRVTGVPPTEEHLERTRGAAYRAYRARTSAFVPWFPRKSAPSHERSPAAR